MSHSYATPQGFHRHENGGGLVADTATVADTAYVGPNARVFDQARVLDMARVSGTAKVSADATVLGAAKVWGNAKVYGTAMVLGAAKVSGNAKVSGCARVIEKAKIFGNADVSGNAYVFGSAKVSGSAEVLGDAYVYGTARVSDIARISGTARISRGHIRTGVRDGEEVTRSLSMGKVPVLAHTRWTRAFSICGQTTCLSASESGRPVLFSLPMRPNWLGRNVAGPSGGYSAKVFEFGTDGPRLIVAAVDGSDTSLRAGAYAAGLARRQNSRLVLVYVHQTSGALSAAVPGAAALAMETSASIVGEIRQDILVHGPRLGIDVSLVERRGSPYHEIASLAEELHADALVVGASMQAGHRIVGSLATHLVRSAHCPVTVVP